MPYQIVRSGRGYKVQSKDTGKVHSSKPMSKEKAMAQMRALYSAMGKEAQRGKK